MKFLLVTLNLVFPLRKLKTYVRLVLVESLTFECIVQLVILVSLSQSMCMINWKSESMLRFLMRPVDQDAWNKTLFFLNFLYACKTRQFKIWHVDYDSNTIRKYESQNHRDKMTQICGVFHLNQTIFSGILPMPATSTTSYTCPHIYNSLRYKSYNADFFFLTPPSILDQSH